MSIPSPDKHPLTASDEEYVDLEVAQALGISEEAYSEIVAIVGRRPKNGELSTLLAMWESNGRQQSLLGWLRGQQHHATAHSDYLYSGTDSTHTAIREPRVKECLAIAHALTFHPTAHPTSTTHGQLLYMIGHISDSFLHSDYARHYLHLAEQPVALADGEQAAYNSLIIDALHTATIIGSHASIGRGGLFGTLLAICGNSLPTPCGFDILTCREVRLDAFLFGEEGIRTVASIDESNDDTFLLKMDEAGLNCCFLGRATRGRIIIDGMDFGDVAEYIDLQ